MKDLNKLLINTKTVLEKLSEISLLKNFTFVGGSALTVYLNHRHSEDIDLFTWFKELDKEKILKEINKCFSNNVNIINISNIQLDLIVSNVKVTFLANGWDKLKIQNNLLGNINIASLELLTGMKINSLFLRAKFRDYYDIYSINKEIYSIEEMYKIIKKYMPEINKKLFQIALIYTKDIEENNIKHLQPKYNINLKEISKHFENEISKWIYINS